MGPNRVSDCRLNRVGVGYADHDLAAMLRTNVVEGRDHASLHLRETFAVWKSKSTWSSLNGFPLWFLHQHGQFGSRPIAKIALDEAFVDSNLLI